MKFIIPVVIGAIIGYITNWLAIKMLFRPLGEKKIFGLRLPFTPGLIPKERIRIAKSIGDTVGTHLLSPEYITSSLCSPEIKSHIGSFMEKKLETMAKSQNTVGEMIQGFTGDKYQSITHEIENSLLNFIVAQTKREDFKAWLMDFVELQGNTIFNGIVKTGGFTKIRVKLAQYSGRILESKEFENAISGIVDANLKRLEYENRALHEIIPGEFVDIIKEYIYRHDSEIAGVLKDSLNSVTMQNSIRDALEDFIEQSLGKLVTVFIKPEAIANKMLEAAAKYLDNQENHINISILLANTVDKLLDSKASDLTALLSGDFRDRGIAEITSGITSMLRDESSLEKVFDMLEKRAYDSSEEIRNQMLSYIKRSLEGILSSDGFKDALSHITLSVVDGIMQTQVSAILKYIDREFGSGLRAIVENGLEAFIRDNAGDMIELMDVSSLVENRINEFDTAFVEKMILDISKKELNAITWLGALLGGIIGVLSPLIESITR